GTEDERDDTQDPRVDRERRVGPPFARGAELARQQPQAQEQVQRVEVQERRTQQQAEDGRPPGPHREVLGGIGDGTDRPRPPGSGSEGAGPSRRADSSRPNGLRRATIAVLSSARGAFSSSAGVSRSAAARSRSASATCSEMPPNARPIPANRPPVFSVPRKARIPCPSSP